jgi:hypothetical protein
MKSLRGRGHAMWEGSVVLLMLVSIFTGILGMIGYYGILFKVSIGLIALLFIINLVTPLLAMDDEIEDFLGNMDTLTREKFIKDFRRERMHKKE